MKEAYNFLRKCGTFYLATEENGQPRVRPFGAISDFEGKLYIETNNQKKTNEYYALLNFSLPCLHLGHFQSSGRSSNAVPSCSEGS